MASHVPFTHHKSISNRAVVGDYVTKLTEPVTVQGFAGVWCAADGAAHGEARRRAAQARRRRMPL